MSVSTIESLRIKAKLLQKSKARSGKSIALKEAYALIATTAGYQSWQEMKSVVEMHELIRPKHFSMTSIWYSTYQEGKTHIDEHGGYLLPYQKQYFVCKPPYLQALGLELEDPDLDKVGTDWAKPADDAAFGRLLDKIRRAQVTS
ncbi:MAG: hypothetical protein R3332_04795 [Pseudohongiellaceae bacterium]|nr:hypothetical protein [Pseudohongiellaceae bacterium]